VLIRGIRGGSIGHEFHEFHENDHGHFDVIGLKCNFSQSLLPRCLTPTFNCTRLDQFSRSAHDRTRFRPAAYGLADRVDALTTNLRIESPIGLPFNWSTTPNLEL